MSLVNRVSAFFLAALAVALIGNSALFYALVQYHWSRQFDQQLHGALHTLVAAVEVETDDVKWEPSDHTIALGTQDGVEDVRWVVCDEQGQVVDHSRNLLAGQAASDRLFELARSERKPDEALQDSGTWRILQQRLAAPAPKPAEERTALEHAALVVTVGRSPGELNGNLRLVAVLVSSLPVAVWIVAAVLGRLYCAQALRPVRAMAAEARAMTASPTNQRLPMPESRDELADLGEAFNALLEQLYQALERQRRFTDDAAHQLRTPLTALLGQIDVALRRPREADEYCHTLNVVHEQARELREIIEGLLFLARVEGDAPAPGAEPLNLADWLPQYVGRWQRHPRYADLQVKVSGAAHIVAASTLLSQLLDNLIGNALKYSAPGKPVTITVSSSGQQVIVAVEDQGAGIAAADREAIFQPFFRTEQARRSGIAGRGLGLAIAAQIAQVLGGQLTCRSAGSGEGSVFALSLAAQ